MIKPLDSFCIEYPADCDVINGYLDDIMPGEGSISILDAMMEWDEDYYSGIYIPNFDGADWTLAPLITPGIDVDDQLYPELTEDAAYIYYQGSSNDEVQVVIMDEPYIHDRGCERPVIVTTHISKGKRLYDPCNECDRSYGTFGTDYDYYEYKIINSHERYGWEVEVFTISGHLETRKDCPNCIPYYLGRFGHFDRMDIKHSDVGQQKQQWIDIISGKPSYFYGTFPQEIARCNTVFNIVEIDWFKSPKRALTIYAPDGKTKTADVARTWTSDWYAFDPYQTHYGFVCRHPAQWNTNWVKSPNAEFNVWRMD